MAQPPGSTGPVAPREYVVHTDKPAVRRRHIGILVMHAVLALAMVALIIVIEMITDEVGGASFAGLPFLALLVGQIFQLSLHSYVYGSRIAISEPMTITARGIELNTQSGRIEMGWEAVASVRIGHRLWHRMLIIQPHPASEPNGPGIETDVSARVWRQLKRVGVHLGAVGLREELDEIIGAIGWFSNGRVPVA